MCLGSLFCSGEVNLKNVEAEKQHQSMTPPKSHVTVGTVFFQKLVVVAHLNNLFYIPLCTKITH